MFLPLGFELRSVITSLGKMVYYTAEGEIWQAKDTGIKEDLPSLVFLHGFGGGSSAYEWSKVYPAFADDYRILAPDLIGWGKESQFTKSEIGKRLADLNQQSVRYFQQLEGVGLTPQLEVPSVTIGLIRKYLRLLS